MGVRPRFSQLLIAFAATALAMIALLASSAAALPPNDVVEVPAPAETTSEPPCSSLCEPPPKVEYDPERSVLVLNVGWNTGKEATSSPLDGQLDTYVSYINGYVDNWFAQASGGTFKPWQAYRGAEFAIAAPTITTANTEKCDSDTFWNTLYPKAEEGARQRGINPDAYADVFVHWSKLLCNVNGITNGRHLGTRKLAQAPVHELGHTLGSAHANAIICEILRDSPPRVEGVTLSTPENCHLRPYGDLYDTMGFGGGDYSAQFQSERGWLTPLTLEGGYYKRTVLLRPLTGTVRGERAVRLRDSGATYWLEYRAPIGLDAPGLNADMKTVTPGVVVHRQGPTEFAWAGPSSELIDMTPESFDFGDSALTLGRTWANPIGAMRISIDAISEAGATVTIASQRVPVPNVIGGTRAAAVTAIAAADLHFAGSKSVHAENCDQIGTVTSTVPAVGVPVPRGGDVTVTIGEGEKGKLCQ